MHDPEMTDVVAGSRKARRTVLFKFRLLWGQSCYQPCRDFPLTATPLFLPLSGRENELCTRYGVRSYVAYSRVGLAR